MSDKKNENALQVRDGCAEGVNGEWVINRAHGVSRERMKNDGVCSDESAASCTHRTAVLTINSLTIIFISLFMMILTAQRWRQ